MFLIGLLLQTLFLVGLAECALRSQSLSLRKVGLTRPTLSLALAGVVLGVILAFGIFWFGALEERLCQWLLPPQTFKSLIAWTNKVSAENAFKQIPSSSVMLLFALVGSIAAPIGEETLFRGLIYTHLKRCLRPGSLAPMLISALLFALLHISPLLMLPTFAMGLAFAAAYERTGSLWVPIVMHGVNNGIIFTMIAWSIHKI